ncbi:MAG: Fic family protein [Acidobacteriota bacterium]|nr:Fic family protein [Acidobacteriota bacterium]
MIEAIDRFQDDFTPTHEILRLISEIDEFKGKWTALRNLSPERLSALRRVATIESVGSSTRIEGVKLNDREVETLLAGLKEYSFRSRDEEEVAGYAEAMGLIFESWREIDLTENHIEQIHSVLLKFSSKDVSHRGKYKKFPNNVVAFDENGREIGVVFETATPFDTSREMEHLLRWTNDAIKKEKIHRLLIVAVFVVCFLAIHPFQDGNGRISRVLTTLLLMRFGYEYVPYSSLESVIEDNKDLYYKALRQTQKTLSTKDTDWGKWCLFFLKCLKKQKDKLTAKLEREKIIAQDLPKLSEDILGLLREHGKLGISEIETLTGGNKNTLKVRLRELVKANFIEQNGQGRATFYNLKLS